MMRLRRCWLSFAGVTLCLLVSPAAADAGSAIAQAPVTSDAAPAAAQPAAPTAPPGAAYPESSDPAIPAAAPPAGPYPPPGSYPPPGYPPPYAYYPPPPDTRPLTLEYEPGQPIPKGYVLQSSARRGMVIPGSIAFGVSYGISIYSAALFAAMDPADRPTNAGWLYAPVLGPWILLAVGMETCNTQWNIELQRNERVCSRDNSLDQLLALDAGAQSIGAALTILGLTWRYEYLMRVDTARVTVLPMVIGRSGCGLTALGTF